ncbi:hypothetical protein ACFL3A_09615 [Pseudomonadota bacterium]
MTGKKNKLDKPDKQDKKEKSGKKRKSDIPGRKEKTGKDNKSRKHEIKEKDGKSSKQGKNNKSGKDKKLRKHEKKAKTVSDSEHAQKHKTVKVAHQDARAMHRAPDPSLTDTGKADAEPLQDTTTASKRHLPVRLILAGSLIVLAGVWWGYQYSSTEPEVKKALPYKTGIAPMVQHKSQPGTATREQRSIRPPLPVPEKTMARSPDIAHTEKPEHSPATTPPVRHTYRPEQATKTENDPEAATAPQQASRPVAPQPQSRHRPQPYGQYQPYPGRGWPSWQGNYPQQPYYRQPGYLGSE